MKKIVFLLFSSIVFHATTFAQKQFAYQVECVSVENSGSISVNIWNTKKGKKYSQLQARKDAIHAILFSGVTGSNGCINQKPILATPESIEAFKKIERDFFSKKGAWSKFTRDASTTTTLPKMVGEENWKVYQVSISKDLLRKYLEEHKIIKSLNTGF